MPWTKKDFPDSMKNLPKAVRDKAIDIANTLLEERNMDEGIAIATGISRAKDWAVNHGKKIEPTKKGAKQTDVKEHGKDQYVVPKEKGWAVKKEGSKKTAKVFARKKQAVETATKAAKKANASVTIQKKTGKVEKRISYNPNKKR